MKTNTAVKLKRIQRISVVLRAGCTALLAIVGLIAVFAVVATLAGRTTAISTGSQSWPLGDLGLGSRAILAAALFATFAVFAKAVYHLRRLMGNYSRGEIFTAASARQIRQFGISCVLWGVLKIAWAFLPLILYSHLQNPFELNLDSLIIGLVIIGISWFTEMATELREENELTI